MEKFSDALVELKNLSTDESLDKRKKSLLLSLISVYGNYQYQQYAKNQPRSSNTHTILHSHSQTFLHSDMKASPTKKPKPRHSYTQSFSFFAKKKICKK